MRIKGQRNNLFITCNFFGTVKYLLVPLVDSIKVSDNDDAHMPIVSELLRRREYSDRLGLAINVVQ